MASSDYDDDDDDPKRDETPPTRPSQNATGRGTFFCRMVVVVCSSIEFESIRVKVVSERDGGDAFAVFSHENFERGGHRVPPALRRRLVSSRFATRTQISDGKVPNDAMNDRKRTAGVAEIFHETIANRREGRVLLAHEKEYVERVLAKTHARRSVNDWVPDERRIRRVFVDYSFIRG